ncbi:MAG: DNA polymerase I [Synergistaceae bacterium]|nr:DNA polymerase I [Synergistaceae bacterium]
MIHIKTFLIVDGHGIAHRAYHAVNAHLTAPDGTPTSAIVGFMNMLYRVQDELLPDCTIVVFDASGSTSGIHAFRYDLQPDYKSGRKPTPEDLKIQLGILPKLLEALGFRVVIREEVEADDAAASIARLAEASGHNAVVLSSDKDLFQILSPHIKMMRPISQGVSRAEIYDTRKFMNEYGFPPASMADYLALFGDKIDNIKGVRGIGDLTAKKLLAVYPTIEAVFSALDDLPKAVRTKLQAAGMDSILWCRDNMIRLRDNIFDDDAGFLDECLNFQPNIPEAEEIAANLGLTRILSRMGSKKQVKPRLFTDPEKFSMPECEILTADYKPELKAHPENFPSTSVWDLHTAYYLLHPDTAGAKFPELLAYVKSSKDPALTLAENAGSLQAEINTYPGLGDVMKNIDLPLIPVLNRMEEHGVRISEEHFSALSAELEEHISQLEAELIHKTGVRINLNSPQQVSWLLFEHLGFEPLGKTKAGALSVDASVLSELSKREDTYSEIPRMLLEFRELSKMLTGFVVPFGKSAGEDGILHTTFEPAATGTGRLSSRDPNLQNIPAFGEWAEKIKAGMLPVQEGNVFVGADYSQIELRVLAHLSGEERLADAFRNGRDIHTETASGVFGVMPELVTPELRRTAKMINFGLLYGMSEFGLAERLGVGRAEAKEIMSKYFSALPGLKKFLRGVVEEARLRGFTRTLAGRIRPVKEIPARSQAVDRALINTPIQGTAADIARKAMIEADRKMKGKMFLQVHDSIVCECPENEAGDVSELLREIMRSSGGEINTLEVEIKQGKSLADV